jgi:ribosome-associated protein
LGTHHESGDYSPANLKDLIVQALDENKAEEIEVIDLMGQTSLADYMIIASGTSTRQVAALAGKIDEKLNTTSSPVLRIEGLPAADWVVVDCGDVIVHIFRPEVRAFYSIEKMWNATAASAPKNSSTRVTHA